MKKVQKDLVIGPVYHYYYYYTTFIEGSSHEKYMFRSPVQTYKIYKYMYIS